VQSALTGHLVFSTLHTNDAAGAISRLLEMGVEDYLLASSLLAVMAQRLVRTLCPQCRRPAEGSVVPSGNGATTNGTTNGVKGAPTIAFEARGCEACDMTGYHGRNGIFELLTITEGVRQLVLKRSSSDIIKTAAVNQGMRTLREDGWRKVREGSTTVAEVLRVTQDE
jgi:general secretion pathway protein E